MKMRSLFLTLAIGVAAAAFAAKPVVPVVTENYDWREVFSRGVYDRLKAEDPAKWANWHYLSGVEMLPNDDRRNQKK